MEFHLYVVRSMRVTVCELRNDAHGLELDWKALVEHVKSKKSDLVLLPEMPFHKWVVGTKKFDPSIWQQAVRVHDHWIARLVELAPAMVIGSRPVIQNGKRHNEGFTWRSQSGYQPSHTKYYLPDEEGFWEASWYERGLRDFAVVQCGGIKVGFLICTELWFFEHAREYGKRGIHLLVCPRVTPQSSVDKWIAGGRTAAVVSGAFCLSSNLTGPNTESIAFGGSGWVIEPEEGNVLGVTSRDQPFITLEIDLEKAEKAKRTYPRYVSD
jgi:N-carbamoylputrescine amidase